MPKQDKSAKEMSLSSSLLSFTGTNLEYWHEAYNLTKALGLFVHGFKQKLVAQLTNQKG